MVVRWSVDVSNEAVEKKEIRIYLRQAGKALSLNDSKM
jgi:hypothetical protein